MKIKIAFYEVFKLDNGKWTFIHKSAKRPVGMILDIYKTREKARKMAALWKLA